MKPLLAIVLLLVAAPAVAQEATCTYTYNQYAKRIEKTCRGNVPLPGLSVPERVALQSGTVKVCVVKTALDSATNKLVVPAPVCTR